MGVTGLWPLLDSCDMRKVVSLSDFGLSHLASGTSYRVGIDGTAWLVAAENGNYDVSQARSDRPLEALFGRLLRLQTAAFRPILVFDGRDLPPIKRGLSTKGRGGISQLEKRFGLLATAMGVGVRKAAGEGEAELAMLFKEGHIDAVMSDDGDAFMFGATTVIRNFSTQKQADKTLKDHATALNSNESIKLRSSGADLALAIYRQDPSSPDQDAIITIAVLAGSDYSKGIKGVGVTLAMDLVRAGVGTSLAVAFSKGRRGGENVMSAELADWREGVAKLLEDGVPTTDSRKPMRHASLARQLRASTSFPDANVLGYLFHPSVTSSLAPPPTTSTFPSPSPPS